MHQRNPRHQRRHCGAECEPEPELESIAYRHLLHPPRTSDAVLSRTIVRQSGAERTRERLLSSAPNRAMADSRRSGAGARRYSRSRPDHRRGRAALHQAARRLRRGRDQGRTTRRRPHPQRPALRRRYPTPRTRPAVPAPQHQQALRHDRPGDRGRPRTAARPHRAGRRRRGGLRPRRRRGAGHRLRAALREPSGAHLLLDHAVGTERPVRGPRLPRLGHRAARHGRAGQLHGLR